MLVQKLEERIVKGPMYTLLNFEVLAHKSLFAKSISTIRKGLFYETLHLQKPISRERFPAI